MEITLKNIKFKVAMEQIVPETLTVNNLWFLVLRDKKGCKINICAWFQISSVVTYT